MSQTGEIVFVSFVRAKLRVAAGRCCFRGFAFRLKECEFMRLGTRLHGDACVVSPLSSLQIDANSLVIDYKSFLIASRCFSLRPTASRCVLAEIM